MDNFWVVTLFHLQPSNEELEAIETKAMHGFGAMGVEEYAMNEAEVDALLGERSYSGGDLPLEVLDEVERYISGKPGNYRFFFNNPKEATAFKEEISRDYLCESQIEECPEEDWNAEWKKHYSPILINEKLEVIPSWLKDHESEAQKKIYIYPGMGFGTGSHETTFLCLKLYTEIAHEATSTVLDFGSGSGILGLATLLFSPEAKVDFYDIDLEANKNCYHNAEINNLSDKNFRLLLPEVREKLLPQYDLVFANILENVLMLERDNLISHTKTNGYLILSGLLKHQVPGIVEKYSDLGLILVKHLEKGDWAALLYKKVK
jgi:ribosomal protein L11 methyltransferase